MAVRRDRRVERSRSAVIAACGELVCERGVAGVSLESVADRSGVAKTTIYRHWASREALLADALGALGGPSPVRAGTCLAEDLRHAVGRLAESLDNDRWPGALPSLADAASRDPDLERAHRSLCRDRRRPFVDALERAVARGELSPRVDVETAVDLLAGPLFYRRLLGDGRVDDREFVDAVIHGALAALGARPQDMSGGTET